jgi:hypothetical protein
MNYLATDTCPRRAIDTRHTRAEFSFKTYLISIDIIPREFPKIFSINFILLIPRLEAKMRTEVTPEYLGGDFPAH